ncbi:MAG: hypothetical protein ACRDHO_15245 [Actinomycetota bacterium]
MSTKPVQDAYSIALLRLGSAGDHMESLARLHDDPSLVFGPASVARTILENCARAWWLFAPEIDVRTRIVRGFTERMNSLIEISRFPIPQVRQHGQSRLDRFANGVEAAGFHVVRDRRTGEPTCVEKQRPDATTVIGAQLGDMGEAAYRDLSAVAHGSQHGIISRVEKVTAMPTPPGISLVAPAIRPEEVRTKIAIAVMSYERAFDRRIDLFGWDLTDWKAWKTESGRALHRLLRSGPT